MQLPPNAQRYRAETGEEIIRIPYDRDLTVPFSYRDLFSPDGRLFYPFNIGSSRTSDDNEEGEFVIPHFQVHGSFKASSRHIICEGVVYLRTEVIFSDINVVPLAGHRRTEYIFVDKEGRLYYVDRPEKDWSYSDFRLFLGTADNMQEFPINRTERYRDGGTTIIRTSLGVLYSPTPFSHDTTPTWTALDATSQVPESYELTRLAEGEDVRVTRLFSGNASVFGGVKLELIEKDEVLVS